MATYSVAAKNAALNAIVGQIDAGATNAKLKLRDSGDVVRVTFTLTDPVAPAATGGVVTFDFDPDIQANATSAGTIANFVMTDSADTVVVEGTVATSGAELNLNSLAVATGQTVTITALTMSL